MGQIKKLLETNLVGGSDTKEIYPVTSTKAVYDTSNINLNRIIDFNSIMDLTNYLGGSKDPNGATSYEVMISVVPQDRRALGFICKFLDNNSQWQIMQYTGDTINASDWEDIDNWNVISFNDLAKVLSLDNIATYVIGENKLDPSKVMNGYSIDVDTHALIPDVNFNLTDYIPVNGNTVYSLFGMQSTEGSFALSQGIWHVFNGKKVLKSSILSPGSYTTPSDAVYVRISYPSTGVNNAMVIEGTVKPTTYIAYKEYISNDNLDLVIDNSLNEESTNPVENKAVTAAINSLKDGTGFKDSSIPLEAVQFSTPGINLLNVNASGVVHNSKADSSTGEPLPADGFDLSDFIPVDISGHYSFQLNGFITTAYWYAYRYDKSYTGTFWSSKNTIIVPSNAKYIRVAYHVGGNYKEQMVIEGEVARPYEEYGLRLDVKNVSLSAQNNDVPFVKHYLDEIVLPPIIRAVVGKEMVINLPNVIRNNWDDVYVRVTSSNRGKFFDKKWVYTPSSTENFDVRINLYDHGCQPIMDQTFTVQTILPLTTPAKVLVIGDSTVQAGEETQTMLRLAQEDNFDLTLLGTRGVVGSPNQHEGRGGWTAEMYMYSQSNTSGSVINAFFNPSPTVNQFDFDYYMKQQGYSGVDFVVIQLGINDIFSYKNDDSDFQLAISNFVTNIRAMVSSIRNASGANVIINLTIPCSPSQDKFGEQYGVVQTPWRCKYNTYELNKAVIAGLTGDNSMTGTYVSWFNAAIDRDIHFEDGVHPNLEGYESLGTQLYNMIRSIITTSPVPTPST